jgi:hypothetical protein
MERQHKSRPNCRAVVLLGTLICGAHAVSFTVVAPPELVSELQGSYRSGENEVDFKADVTISVEFL